MIRDVTPITREALVEAAAARVVLGWRLVTITCTDRGDHFDILYHFDRADRLENLRLRLERTQELPSISGVCLAAVPIENELKDLFGVTITGLILDFGGRFVLAENSPVHPHRKPDQPTASAPAAQG